MSPARLRPRAEADLVERTHYYRAEAGGVLATGLRSFRIAGFSCGWFYFERGEHVDVVRLLSYSQHLEPLLNGTDEL